MTGAGASGAGATGMAPAGGGTVTPGGSGGGSVWAGAMLPVPTKVATASRAASQAIGTRDRRPGGEASWDCRDSADQRAFARGDRSRMSGPSRCRRSLTVGYGRAGIVSQHGRSRAVPPDDAESVPRRGSGRPPTFGTKKSPFPTIPGRKQTALSPGSILGNGGTRNRARDGPTRGCGADGCRKAGGARAPETDDRRRGGHSSGRWRTMSPSTM